MNTEEEPVIVNEYHDKSCQTDSYNHIYDWKIMNDINYNESITFAKELIRDLKQFKVNINHDNFFLNNGLVDL